MKKVAYIASESVPFIKTGGLADVVGTLPKVFDKKQYDVRVIIPNYLCIPEKFRNKMTYVTHFYMDMGWKQEYVGVMYLEYEGVKFYFIDNEYYFNGFTPYGDVKWDIEKFCYFSKASLSILKAIDFQADIIHCHDWQAGMVPVYLKTLFAGDLFYTSMKTVMTIHNLQFQGCWDIATLKADTGLPDYLFTPDKLEMNKDASMLKGGLVYADKITTVSNTYAKEIQTPYYGEGLNGLLSARNESLWGIVNGIDYDIWNPQTDSLIAKNYTVKTWKKYKKENKKKLQEMMGLPVDEKQFVIGLVSRLTDQKGLDLIDRVMNEICQDGVQFVIIGTGDSRYENMFRYYQGIHPTKVSANIYYDEAKSHMVYAGADVMLVPSRFEPCGLTQLMALRYGTPPIVRETGGLKDTVEPYNEYDQTGTGFSFANYNAHELLATINYAKVVYYDHHENWEKIVERAMVQDYSWGQSALKYQELYESL
ncbi:MAG: glycogen synthase GlgA [Lachnospiraceae bacterium]|nr:glycogen synthase GlgA [Lachnospiraceae bacterium]